MRHLACSPDDGKWSLSEGRTASVVAETDAGHTFVHLCWNDAGFELAVVDSCGRISTFGMSIALNALNQQRPIAMDHDDDGNQPVGLMWLSANRPVSTGSLQHNSPHPAAKKTRLIPLSSQVYALQKAVRSNGRWSYPRFGRRPMGPLHPGGKSALICVSRAGYLRLLFQQPDSKWSEVSVELRSTGYADDTLTHAGMVPVEGRQNPSLIPPLCPPTELPTVTNYDCREWDLTCNLLVRRKALSLPCHHQVGTLIFGIGTEAD